MTFKEMAVSQDALGAFGLTKTLVIQTIQYSRSATSRARIDGLSHTRHATKCLAYAICDDLYSPLPRGVTVEARENGIVVERAEIRNWCG